MRAALYALLAAVALAAALLSFAALRDLAVLCGFTPSLAWLLPVVVDMGAAAGTLVWLGGRAGDRAQRFARRLAMVLLGLSVAANAVSHLIALYSPGRPPWWVVAVASGIAPAVLWAIVHLVVLWRAACRDTPAAVESQAGIADPPGPGSTTSEPAAAPADTSGVPPAGEVPPTDPPDRAAELIAAGYGRRRLARELQMTPHEARVLLAARRNGSGP